MSKAPEPMFRVNKIFHPDGKCDAWEVQMRLTAYDGKPWWSCLTREPFSREHDALRCLEAVRCTVISLPSAYKGDES